MRLLLQPRVTGVLILAFFALASRSLATEMIVVDRDGPVAEVVVDGLYAEAPGRAILDDAAIWLVDSIEQATGHRLQLAPEPGEESRDTPAIILGLSKAYPEVARTAKMDSQHYDAYCIQAQGGQVYVLGNSPAATRHGVAALLHEWGFRWFAPSPRWHHVPKVDRLVIDRSRADRPALQDRRIWYAYGMRGDDLAPLMQNYQRWAIANRLSVAGLANTGHSYGNIIGRNPADFQAHPEYFALLENGKRDNKRSINARKFCVSNPGLVELVAQDRIRLLEEQRRRNPAAYMVSVDPSDGEGTCYCEDCKALGTTSDRVFHLANEVARRLREHDPQAWVGLYAYSSHRLPPTIDIEPNVYVQVAMGFNRTRYTLPELVGLWSQKVGAIGLREYYGVEAWDWGLPGRMRGGQVAYHSRWIPYYAERKLNAINAETNSNWGGQTLGLYVAAQLMWQPDADVDALVDEYFRLAFGDAEPAMRRFYQKLDEAPPLRPSALVPLFDDLLAAQQATQDPQVLTRITDLKAYLLYIVAFRDFDLVRSREPQRNDAYYSALKPLMQFAWQIRDRDMVHYYALARRLCNGLPVQDGRLEFYIARKDKPPVWQAGPLLSDDEIDRRFQTALAELRDDDDPTVHYSRYLDPVRPDGDDAGASSIVAKERKSVARFRGKLRAYLVPAGRQTITMGIVPLGKQARVTVYLRGDEVLYEGVFQPDDKETDADDSLARMQTIQFELPKANEYRVDFAGEFELQVPEGTPFMFEASVANPAWISYSGPHYFYVPKGTRELIVDMNPRLSLQVPGQKARLDLVPADREPERQYAIVPVPNGQDGRVWHTTNMTRGQVMLLNTPPLLSFHRDTVFVPREVAEADGLTTKP